MRVKDLMVTKNLLVVKEDDRLALAGQMRTGGRLRHVPVLRGAEVVGVVSERDILAHQGGGADRGWEDLPIRQVMRHPPVVISADHEVEQAAARMAANHIGCLPVVEHGRLIGIITSTDIVGVVVNNTFAERPSLRRPIREVMHGDVYSVGADDDLMEAVDLMFARQVRHLPVVEKGGRVIGILSDRDVRAAIGNPAEALEAWNDRAGRLPVSAVMTANVITARIDAPLAVALRHLLGRQVGALPIVDGDDRLRGILSYVDVLRALRRY